MIGFWSDSFPKKKKQTTCASRIASLMDDPDQLETERCLFHRLAGLSLSPATATSPTGTLTVPRNYLDYEWFLRRVASSSEGHRTTGEDSADLESCLDPFPALPMPHARTLPTQYMPGWCISISRDIRYKKNRYTSGVCPCVSAVYYL